MREIKLRAWDKYKKEMIIEPEEVTSNRGVIFFGRFDTNEDYYELEMMQFTGLKDKNDKEVYEGDIVNYEDDSLTKQTGKIVWAESSCCFWIQAFNGDDEGNQDAECHADSDIEVIGNIHKNKELLK